MLYVAKTIESLRNKINVRLAINKKDYLKWTSKPSYMSQKYLVIYLVIIYGSNSRL